MSALDQKEALLVQIRSMNDEAASGIHSSDGVWECHFRRAYAVLLLRVRRCYLLSTRSFDPNFASIGCNIGFLSVHQPAEYAARQYCIALQLRLVSAQEMYIVESIPLHRFIADYG